MLLNPKIYEGSVLGIGYSAQAGSAFPVLGVLHHLKEKAAQEGKQLRTVFAFDPQANPLVSPLIGEVVQALGLEAAHVRETPIAAYRAIVDQAAPHFYGADPDLEAYVEDEVRLFEAYRPSLVITTLRQTVHFSRALYRQRTGQKMGHLTVVYGMLIGNTTKVGIPANFFSFAQPRPVEKIVERASGLTKVAYLFKEYLGRRYIFSHAPPGYRQLPFPGFWASLHGDVTLIPSSPLFLSGEPPRNSHLVGPVAVRFPLSEEQRTRQETITRQVQRWKENGAAVALVAMGTSGAAFPNVLQALEACSQRQNGSLRMVVATTSLTRQYRDARETLRRMVESGIAVSSDWFDLERLMPLMDLYINHGGLNTLEIALNHEVPSFIVAPRQVEQGVNGLLLRRAGLGELLWEHRLRELPAVLHQMVHSLDTYRRRIRAYRTRHAAYYDTQWRGERLTQVVNEVLQ